MENVRFKVLTSLPAPIMSSVVKASTANPYKEFNDRYKAIYIHIPKNAGQSIEKALFEGKKVGHVPLRNYESHDKNRFNRYFKFTIVRNPWDRMVSAYQYLIRGGKNNVDSAWAKLHLAPFKDFQEFLYELNDRKFRSIVLSWQHFRPQIYYMKDCHNRINIDYIGRFENLAADFNYITKKIGSVHSLPHENKSVRKRNWKEYYNRDTFKMLEDKYKEDIYTLGYNSDHDFTG